METFRDELAIVQAQVAVQHLVLQSLVHSHPQPDLLLEQWRRLRADRVAQAYSLPADARSSDWLSQHMQVFAEDWTAELVDVIARRAGHQRGGSVPESFRVSSARLQVAPYPGQDDPA